MWTDRGKKEVKHLVSQLVPSSVDINEAGKGGATYGGAVVYRMVGEGPIEPRLQGEQ